MYRIFILDEHGIRDVEFDTLFAHRAHPLHHGGRRVSEDSSALHGTFSSEPTVDCECSCEFARCLPGCPLVRHAEGDHDGERREEEIPLRYTQTQQTGGGEGQGDDMTRAETGGEKKGVR